MEAYKLIGLGDIEWHVNDKLKVKWVVLFIRPSLHWRYIIFCTTHYVLFIQLHKFKILINVLLMF